MVNNPVTPLPLRDIHLPETILWWPLAPGWWVLFILGISLLIGIALWYKRKRNLQHIIYHSAKKELQQLQEKHADSPKRLVAALSILVRRVAISLYPHQDVAPLSGEAWLLFLDQTMPDSPFSRGIGRGLMTWPYQACVDEVDMLALVDLIGVWIERNCLPQRGCT